MNRREAYRKAMVESIKNSGMWLKEARLLAEKGSEGHAQALVIFSGEELGKALMCWMTINGVFPFNHWEVDYRNKRGIFRNHSLKNATALGFTLALLTHGGNDKPEVEGMIDSWTGEQIELREFLAKMGASATWARSRWMYVDIESNEKSLRVSSPLLEKPCSIEDALNDAETCLRMFKKLVRLAQANPAEFAESFLEFRELLMEKDERFPESPEWE